MNNVGTLLDEGGQNFLNCRKLANVLTSLAFCLRFTMKYESGAFCLDSSCFLLQEILQWKVNSTAVGGGRTRHLSWKCTISESSNLKQN